MSHWNDDWTPEDVLNNYQVLSFVDPEDMNQLVNDSLMFKVVSAYLEKEHPSIYADAILKGLIK